MRKLFLIVCALFFVIAYASAQDTTFTTGLTCVGNALTGSWIVPNNVTSITVQVYGAGGGGGGGGGGSNGGLNNTRGGGGGGGGGYATISINVTPGSTFSYSVGTGGCGGNNGTDLGNGSNGTNGGNTTFTGTATGGTPVTLTANGGAGGDRGTYTGNTGLGGAGGSASGGSTNTPGAAGAGGSGAVGGAGGAGAGPNGGTGGLNTNDNGTLYGGAGAGGGDSDGGNGAGGAVLITYDTTTAVGINNQPANTNTRYHQLRYDNGIALICVNLAEYTTVQLEVFDFTGKKVAATASEYYNPGLHTLRIPGIENLAAGVYAYRLYINGSLETGTLMRQ